MAKKKSGSRPAATGATKKPDGRPVSKRGLAGAANTRGRMKKKATPAKAKKAAKPVGEKKPGKDSAAPAKLPRGRARTEHPEVPIVAVGASAGGLEAFTQLLQALSPDTGMAFVLVSHLSHTHKSMLSELLAKATMMPVEEVGRRVAVRANHVYVIPPNVDLNISDGEIRATPVPKNRRPHMAIDHFMRSLAERRKSRAIGVVLSGSGSDGTFGLAAIKAEGGVTFVQDEKSARYPDMPRSAWAAGASDFRLPPDQIAEELSRIARHPYVIPLKRSDSAEEKDVPRGELDRLFGLVHKATGVDFSYYKPTTIRRRISRRMLVHRINSMRDYLALLRGDSQEVEALFQDLLINVTGFFRDSEMFDVLKKEFIPPLLSKRARDKPLRAWIPGCATGEEAYSIAICLIEALGDAGANPPLQIFGTDVSEASIKRARAGRYPQNISADVSAERLRRFFVHTESGFQVAPAVRDLCVFATQNLINDPPFSRIDLISCRNLLIYLGPILQKRALSTFHYALQPGGVLVLGTSESVGPLAREFQTANKKFKIYTKLRGEAPSHFEYGPREPGRERRKPGRAEVRVAGPSPDLGRQVERLLLKRYAPAGVLVNQALEIVHFQGQTSPFLEPAPGQASLSLLKMAREGLLIDLRGALHQAQRDGQPVRKEGVRIRNNGGVQTVSIDVVPIPGESEKQNYYLVLFEPSPGQQPVENPKPGARRQRRNQPDYEREIATLRQELATTQEDLHSIIEEQEANNEELQSANEEILSSNEELQSTNEELETAKEELQATNEELSTVNDELQNRNGELTQTNNDLVNLLASVEIVILMISQDLRIRRFTPSAQRVMNLIAGDVGRPLRDINTRLQIPDLEKLIAEVIDTMTVRELEIQDAAGRWYSLRVRPYRTLDNKIDGAVLALVEVDDLKRVEQKLQLLSRVFQAVSNPIIVQDLAGRIIELNQECEKMYGWAPKELLGKAAKTLVPGDRQEQVESLLRRCEQGEEVRDVESAFLTKDRKQLSALISLSLIQNQTGEPVAIATIAKHLVQT